MRPLLASLAYLVVAAFYTATWALLPGWFHATRVLFAALAVMYLFWAAREWWRADE